MHNENLLIRTALQRSRECLATADRIRLVRMARVEERQARHRGFDLTTLYASIRARVGRRAV